jgi:hypothetical protein
MPPATVIRLEDGYTDEPDCAVVALAMYLGASYPEVIRAVATLDRRRGRGGVSRRGLVRVAAVLGHTLRKRKLDPWDGEGIIYATEHAAVLLRGRVADRLTNWPLEAWLKDQHADLEDCDFFVAVD